MLELLNETQGSRGNAPGEGGEASSGTCTQAAVRSGVVSWCMPVLMTDCTREVCVAHMPATAAKGLTQTANSSEDTIRSREDHTRTVALEHTPAALSASCPFAVWTRDTPLGAAFEGLIAPSGPSTISSAASRETLARHKLSPCKR